MAARPRDIGDASGAEAQRRRTGSRLVKEAMGAPDGVVIVAESGFPHTGHASMDAVRQYGGALDTIEKCQGGDLPLSRAFCASKDASSAEISGLPNS
jgi:hypothetical protein